MTFARIDDVPNAGCGPRVLFRFNCQIARGANAPLPGATGAGPPFGPLFLSPIRGSGAPSGAVEFDGAFRRSTRCVLPAHTSGSNSKNPVTTRIPGTVPAPTQDRL